MSFAAKTTTKILNTTVSRRAFSSAPSAASRLIQRRATTGSVSSVFYLKNLPGKNGKQQKEQASFIENVFTGLVGVPIACLGLGGLYRMASDGKLWESTGLSKPCFSFDPIKSISFKTIWLEFASRLKFLFPQDAGREARRNLIVNTKYNVERREATIEYPYSQHRRLLEGVNVWKWHRFIGITQM